MAVYGSNKLLDFLYLNDCVDALVAAMERINAVRGEVLNVGSDQGYSLVHLAEMVIDRVGVDIDISVDPALSGEVDRFAADIKRA